MPSSESCVTASGTIEHERCRWRNCNRSSVRSRCTPVDCIPTREIEGKRLGATHGRFRVSCRGWFAVRGGQGLTRELRAAFEGRGHGYGRFPRLYDYPRESQLGIRIRSACEGTSSTAPVGFGTPAGVLAGTAPRPGGGNGGRRVLRSASPGGAPHRSSGGWSWGGPVACLRLPSG